MPIVNSSALAGIQFACNLMTTGQTYYNTATGPTPPIVYVPANCINDLLALPLNPNVSLLISEIADPSNSSANFVEIYNAGSSSVNFDAFYAWFLNANASTSVQLTGTLAAGATYVIANSAADFMAAYPGKTYNLESSVVGTAGNTNYLLSTYGNYTDGTAIDNVSSVDYTGKHAVRMYTVLAPNTTTTASEWVISAAENMDMTPNSHRATVTWDGSANATWRNLSNWTPEFIPDAAHNVTIPNAGETIPNIVFGNNAYCYNLSIGGSNAGLVIKSDETLGDGSLITYGAVTGTASVERFLDADRYWYVSQPVTSAVAGVFLHTWMFTYSETAGNWGAFIEPVNTPLSVMQGYAVWTSSINPWSQNSPPVGDTTVAYTGTLNSGTINKSLSYTVAGGSYGNGWNFTGNPYPSALDWEATGWTRTNLVTNSYSVWNGSTYASYTVGGASTNGGTRYIPAAQGFFVQTTAAGTLGVTNAVRAHSTQDFWKSEGVLPNYLSLTISNTEVSDETVIYFNEEATADLDYSFDARKMMAPAAPQAYTMMDSEKMAINAFRTVGETPSVKLGINANATGEYTISASNIESFDASQPLFLEDLATQQIINLRETGSYTFTAEEGTAERFLVHFTAQQGIGDDPASEITSIYALDRNVYVNYKGENGLISVFNILGQEVTSADAGKGMNIISVPQGNSVYIVKITTETGTVTKKVFVN
jgi:hypothetical protein